MWKPLPNAMLRCVGFRERVVGVARPGLPVANARLSISTYQHRDALHTRRTQRRKSLFSQKSPAIRSFWTGHLPPVLVPPTIFLGLVLGLWTYKCLMTIVFQDKIIYLPYLPPFARYEKLDDYAAICRPARWRQENITSMDGTKLAICVGEIGQASTGNLPHASASCQRKRVVICYFQGNGGSTPPRLPLLSNVLNHLHSRVTDSTPYTEFVIIALSYRGYWKSSGRATEIGIQKDSQALLHHVAARYGGESDIDLQVILWGQSIGAGIALSAASTHLRHTSASTRVNGVGVHLNLPLLILETPFTSIKAMLLTLYPQKWLPYQYLWPFLWNHWDSEKELRKLAAVDVQYRPDVLFIGATRDEVVPAGEADRLEAVSKEVGLVTHRRDVIGALHTDATIRVEGRKIVCSSVVDAISER